MKIAKTCTKCGQTKRRTEFFSRTKSADGLQSWCKPCIRKRGAQWRADNRELIVARERRRRAANPERANECARAWRRANPEMVRAQERRWRQDNPIKCRLFSARHKAKRSGYMPPIDIGMAAFRALWLLQRRHCPICTEALGDDWVIDHDHGSGEIRGYLHNRCNNRTLLDGDPENLRRAYEYVQFPPGARLTPELVQWVLSTTTAWADERLNARSVTTDGYPKAA